MGDVEKARLRLAQEAKKLSDGLKSRDLDAEIADAQAENARLRKEAELANLQRENEHLRRQIKPMVP